MQLEQLRKVERSVGIAGGKRKFEAIRGALRGKLINLLITDRRTAERLIEGQCERRATYDGTKTSAFWVLPCPSIGLVVKMFESRPSQSVFAVVGSASLPISAPRLPDRCLPTRVELLSSLHVHLRLESIKLSRKTG